MVKFTFRKGSYGCKQYGDLTERQFAIWLQQAPAHGYFIIEIN